MLRRPDYNILTLGSESSRNHKKDSLKIVPYIFVLVVNNFNYFLVYNGFSINCKNMSVKNRFSTHPACNFQDQPFCVFSVLFPIITDGLS